MNPSIYEDLSSFIAREILKQPNRQISPQEPLISSGLIDSFSMVDLALHIENNYQVHIDNTELNAQTFDSLEALAILVTSRQKP